METLALARKYTKDTAEGVGAIAGKPCQIQSVTEITGGKRITFLWIDNSSNEHTTTLDVMDGVSVTGGSINASNHLILTLSNGDTVDCGEVPVADSADDIAYENASFPDIGNVAEALNTALSGTVGSAEDVSYTNEGFPDVDNVKEALDTALSGGSVLTNPITVSNPVGSALNGKVYAKGTSLETIIRDMLIKEEAPTITLAISPNKTLYDVVTETVSSIAMSATVAKKTYNLAKIEFYVDNVLKNSQPISTNGTYTYNASWAPATNENFTLKAVVYDSRTGTPMSNSKTVTVKFVAKSYYGIVGADVGEPTESQIKSLQNNVLKDTKNLVYDGITTAYGKVVYAYPASFGNLSSIKDVPNNVQYWPGSFTKLTKTVDGISYNVYVQNEASAAEDIQLTFS